MLCILIGPDRVFHSSLYRSRWHPVKVEVIGFHVFNDISTSFHDVYVPLVCFGVRKYLITVFGCKIQSISFLSHSVTIPRGRIKICAPSLFHNQCISDVRLHLPATQLITGSCSKSIHETILFVLPSLRLAVSRNYSMFANYLSRIHIIQWRVADAEVVTAAACRNFLLLKRSSFFYYQVKK